MTKSLSLVYVEKWVMIQANTDALTHSDRDIGAAFCATTVQPVINGPQQQDKLHSRKHRWRQRVLAAAGYTLYVLPLASSPNLM